MSTDKKSSVGKIDDNEFDFENFDLEKLEHIIQAMEYLRREAVKAGHKDISDIIESAFNIVFVVFRNLMRERFTQDLLS